MVFRKINRLSRTLILAGLMFVGSGFLLSGCVGPQHIEDPSVAGMQTIDDSKFPSFTGPPRVTVNPASLSLGIANILGTEIVFKGRGFKPNDVVFISLLGCDNYKLIEVAVADSRVKPDGSFTATVGNLAKVSEILRADLNIDTYSEKGEYSQALVITREPIPAGVYLVRATGMISDQKAETFITIRDPSIGDRLKDWVGKKTGKIQDERR